MGSVRRELSENRLVEVRLPKGPSLSVEMEVRVYREKQQTLDVTNERAASLWQHLIAQAAT
jgi:hypothetical protein